ncbi:lipid-A-disaccharide synthase [Marinilabilia salmonicolor]|jgi:lipid-A-disaccharide synthase|uniref:Lipid-A-disaccharide synthase n=1 Tax=Marinilabilia salmonicolor TaxID=989 RepID=A0A368UNM3_9BACT|nr:lipid-A-disaccharide synthase [Marinilabilia salmonicolor]RCW30392.1 lipid-A-disaccharide synthase [Marinilabilia salmonicolor]
MRYYIIAGEASGDLHASNLMRELKRLDAEADFRFWGGDLMARQGGKLVRHYRDTAYMGVWEVITHLPSIFKNLNECKEDILRYHPDVLILVDYPGFNLRIANFAHSNGLKVFYYISPKIWAWNKGRVKRIQKWVDKMFTILPFETDFYAEYGVPVAYSGNPLLDAIDTREFKNESREAFLERHQLPDKPIVAVLAGSRLQEIDRIIPDMLKMVRKFPDHQFIVAGAPSFTEADYQQYVPGEGSVKVIFGETYALLQQAKAAMVTSGTATLEAALLKCPQVVCYKMWGGAFTDFMAKKVIIQVPYISLVNLIMNREVVTELFQNDMTEENLTSELRNLLCDEGIRNKMFADYEELQRVMGGPGSSGKTARLMWDSLNG